MILPNSGVAKKNWWLFFPVTFMDLMAPVFNQALKAGHIGFVIDTYIQCISSSLYSRTNILADYDLGVLFNNGVCNKRCQNMGEEIYSNTLFNRL